MTNSAPPPAEAAAKPSTVPPKFRSQRPRDGGYKRSARNYLIDSRFQLKYTGLILFAAVTIAAFLGVFLWRTSGDVVTESQKVVEQSKKVSDVVKMSIRGDAMYADNPILAKEFADASAEQDNKIQAQQDTLVRQQHTMLYALVGGLAVMVFVIGVLGIFFTHKVAGPIYKMKMLLNQVADGAVRVEVRLRKGDELHDFFNVFIRMVDNLRARREAEVIALDRAIADAKAAGLKDDALAVFVRVRDDLKRPLDT